MVNVLNRMADSIRLFNTHHGIDGRAHTILREEIVCAKGLQAGVCLASEIVVFGICLYKVLCLLAIQDIHLGTPKAVNVSEHQDIFIYGNVELPLK